MRQRISSQQLFDPRQVGWGVHSMRDVVRYHNAQRKTMLEDPQHVNGFGNFKRRGFERVVSHQEIPAERNHAYLFEHGKSIERCTAIPGNGPPGKIQRVSVSGHDDFDCVWIVVFLSRTDRSRKVSAPNPGISPHWTDREIDHFRVNHGLVALDHDDHVRIYICGCLGDSVAGPLMKSGGHHGSPAKSFCCRGNLPVAGSNVDAGQRFIHPASPVNMLDHRPSTNWSQWFAGESRRTHTGWNDTNEPQ